MSKWLAHVFLSTSIGASIAIWLDVPWYAVIAINITSICLAAIATLND